MRGGTSKGPFFLASDLPGDRALRDRVLLAAMGSPDVREIDGLGGADTLTSKVAVVGPPTRRDADVDYLFLQVVVDEPRVDDSQNCGNMLAGVGPFAIEHGLVAATPGTTAVRIHMVNTASVAVAHVQTPGGRVRYDGDARIDGVPGTAAPIVIDFLDIAGSSTGGALLADRPRARRRRGRRSHPHRQRHAGGRHAGVGLRQDRTRAARGARVRRGAQSARRERAARRGPADEPRRRQQEDGTEDVPGLAALERGRRLDPQLHPAQGPQGDRRVRRGQRRDGLRVSGDGRRRDRGRRRASWASAAWRSSTRRASSPSR